MTKAPFVLQKAKNSGCLFVVSKICKRILDGAVIYCSFFEPKLHNDNYVNNPIRCKDWRLMMKNFKKIWNVVTTILVAVVVMIAVLLVGARVIGLQVFTVLSGSMEPTYHTGSLIYVKDIEPFDLESGDVITFMLDEDTIATHRITEVVPDEEDSTVIRFRTKGDANDVEDGSLVHYKNVIGTPVFTIPYIGYVANYIQNPPGIYAAIATGAILLMLVFIPDLFDDEKGKNKEKGKDLR